MSTEKIDYAVFLADLEAKKAALEGLIANLKTVLSLGALGKPGEVSSFSPSSGGEPIDLPVGAFLGLSIPEAIKLYLSAVRTKRTNRQIAEALKEGGVESTASNFYTVVTGALHGLKGSGQVLRFKDGWGLAELYPEHIRNRVSQGHKKGKKRRKKAAAQPKTSKDTRPNSEKQKQKLNAEEKKDGPESDIKAHFAARPGQELTSKEVAAALGIRGQTAGLLCSKLAHQGKLEKTSEGSFRFPHRSPR